MADGSTKPISQVKVGDQISDAVPGDSAQQTHTVQNVITTTTDRDFVDVTVKPSTLGKVLAGVALAAAATLTITFHHPFYDITQSAFVEAVDLKPGDQVQTADGGTATVTDVHPYHQQATTYDLTINGLHTYYVLAGDTPVLVHNCGTGETKSPDELRADAQALHDAGIRNIQDPPSVGNRRADQGITVATGQLGGRRVYSVSNNATTPEMRALANELGYERINGVEYITPGLQTHAEQILFNAIEGGTLEGDGDIAPSRPACGPTSQNCAGRASDFPGVTLHEQPRVPPWDR